MKVGDKVRHAVYGIGVVERVEGVGLTAEITVRFDEVGVKRLTKAWAPLQILDEDNESRGEIKSRVSSQFSSPSFHPDSPQLRKSDKATSSTSLADQISVQFELYKRGSLTGEEFTAAKAELLKFDA